MKTEEFINILKKLQTIGVDVSKLVAKDTIETLAEKSGISKEKLEEMGLDPAEKIGSKKNTIAQAYRGKGDTRRPTKAQVEELAKLGISLESKEGCKEITGRDVAEATMGSLINPKMADEEDAALKALVKQEEQKRGVDIDEQP